MTRALVIDDNMFNLDVLTVLLEKEGLEVVGLMTAYSLSDVLMEQVPFDVVFLDLQMPYDDGYNILTFLRKQATFQKIPIIAYTVHINELSKAREAGFDGFISKPIDSDHFPQQLERILNGEPVWE